MKLFLKPILLLVVIIVSSCGDDDSVSGLPLVGTTWTEFSFEAKDCEDANKERESTCSGKDCDVIIFNSDGTITLPDVDTSDFDYTYSVSGNKLTLLIENESFSISQTFDFEIIVDKLIITAYDEDVKCTEVYIYMGS